MKSLVQYIKEALNTNISMWFSDILNVQKTAVKMGKLEQIDIDTTKLNKPKQPFNIFDFTSDKNVKEIITNQITGCSVTSKLYQTLTTKIIKNKNAKVFPYFYTIENNSYYIGHIMFDDKQIERDIYGVIYLVDTSNIVKNILDVLKAMCNDYKLYVSKMNASIKGLACKTTDIQIANILKKTGFKQDPDNKELYLVKL